MVEKTPKEKNHQALSVKGERHPTCGMLSNLRYRSQDSNPGRSGETSKVALCATKKPTIC